MPDPLAGVLVISVDGLRPDALQQAETPNIDALIARGAVAWQAKTTLPSATLPGHASMLSGSSPAVHGVTWNSHEPQRGHVPVATLFSVAHAAGLTTAMFVGKPKLEHIAIPGTVDTYGYIAGGDAALALAVAQSLPSAVPDVLFVHLPGVDGAGHSYGWMSPGQLEAVSRADAAIAVILKALETLDRLGQTLVILTADHGGLGTLHGGSQPESMNIPWIIAGPGVQSGFEIQTDVRVYDTAATAVWALGLALPDSWEGRPIEEAFIQ
jgi:predicted AlkP superfamily pyrophosphatase or phosphodiesterase